MLNYLWGGMIIAGIIFGVFSGKMPDITNGALDSAKEAVDLCIVMIGIMSMWSGLMEIATKAGILEGAAKKMGRNTPILISRGFERPSCGTAYYDQYDCERIGAWVGSNAGGTFGNEKSAGVESQSRQKYCKSGHVYFPYT